MIITKHLENDQPMSPPEKIIYMRHVDLSLERAKALKSGVTAGAIRIIEQHHENMDGTGFRGFRMGQIYRPARILRIADAFVSAIRGKAGEDGVRQTLEALAKQVGPSGDPIFDPSIMAQLLYNLGS
jgi:HD-GYP domain-containing protein (c-di-GMP phosphodiesterase class II)